MAITVSVLVLLAAALALPNYLAVRYALLGGVSPQGAAVRIGRKASPGRTAAVAAPRLDRGIYLWKALSPLLFAVCLILGIAVGGVAGIALAAVAFLNLVWGMMGWRVN